MSPPDPPRRPRFRETAIASGLLTPEQMDLAEHTVGRTRDKQNTTDVNWDKAVADVLVGWGWLTRFQADQMLEYARTVFRLGQYTVLDEIGKGGMGQVFRAEHAMMGREVAVKVLPGKKSTPESEAAFRREMRMLGRLDHENLVRAFDAGHDARVYYLVTELVPGIDLKRYVQKHGPLDEETAASVIAQAARGLAYAHEQELVHRDVKPGNLLVTQDGRVKVLDLGLAGSQLEKESSRIGRVVGTMDYIAPEQIQAPDDVGPSADIYALGCTLYYAVTGRVPFPGGSRNEKMQRHLTEAPDPARRLAPHLSEPFCRVIEDMMAKTPEKRIASATAVVERLRPWLPDGQVWNGRGLAVAEATGGRGRDGLRPPMLPSASDSTDWLSGSSFFGTSDSSAGTSIDMGEAIVTAATSFHRTWIARLLMQAMLVAVPVGIGFGWVMSLVRSIEPEQFDAILRDTTPAGLGMRAFLLLFVLQVAAGAAGRLRR